MRRRCVVSARRRNIRAGAQARFQSNADASSEKTQEFDCFEKNNGASSLARAFGETQSQRFADVQASSPFTQNRIRRNRVSDADSGSYEFTFAFAENPQREKIFSESVTNCDARRNTDTFSDSLTFIVRSETQKIFAKSDAGRNAKTNSERHPKRKSIFISEREERAAAWRFHFA